MPELPEVETIRRDLDRELPGERIVRVEARGRRSVRRHPDPTEFVTALVGATVDSVSRRGKYLVVALDRPAGLVVHLGMSGQLLLTPAAAAAAAPALVPAAAAPAAAAAADAAPAAAPAAAAAAAPAAAAAAAPAADAEPPHTHVVLGFATGRELRFVDPRTFGEMFVASADRRELAHLGPDPLADLPTAAGLALRLQARRTKLKVLLMDQGFLAGIGNLYSDEILFAARLRYDRASDTLTSIEVARLHRAMGRILGTAIEARGSSLADEQYRDVFGAIGGYQHHHAVYGREGKACPRCGRAIARIKTGGRSTFLCPHCQA